MDVEISNNETENDKWIYIKDNGYYLLPLLINFYYNENNELKISATIQIHHKEIFPNGIFEYVYPQKEVENAIDGLFELFETWADLDWLTLCDCLKFEKSEYMSMRIDLNKGKTQARHVFYGAILVIRTLMWKRQKRGELMLILTLMNFCPCCLLQILWKPLTSKLKIQAKITQ